MRCAQRGHSAVSADMTKKLERQREVAVREPVGAEQDGLQGLNGRLAHHGANVRGTEGNAQRERTPVSHVAQV